VTQLWDIEQAVDELLGKLQELTRIKQTICQGALFAGVDTATRPGLAELEEVRQKTEQLRSELNELSKHRSKLDPHVREIDRKLDEALSQYYWLWQKCKSNM
jgi:predicted nuclease with TOPRIM domain